MRNINMKDYESEFEKSSKPTLIDFYASWCGPCKMVSPIMEQLDQKYDGKVDVVKVDVDSQKELAFKFDVMSIPTVVLMKDGKVLERSVGARPVTYYESIIDSADRKSVV